jgi:hypothetical protein
VVKRSMILMWCIASAAAGAHATPLLRHYGHAPTTHSAVPPSDTIIIPKLSVNLPPDTIVIPKLSTVIPPELAIVPPLGTVPEEKQLPKLRKLPRVFVLKPGQVLPATVMNIDPGIVVPADPGIDPGMVVDFSREGTFKTNINLTVPHIPSLPVLPPSGGKVENK